MPLLTLATAAALASAMTDENWAMYYIGASMTAAMETTTVEHIDTTRIATMVVIYSETRSWHGQNADMRTIEFQYDCVTRDAYSITTVVLDAASNTTYVDDEDRKLALQSDPWLGTIHGTLCGTDRYPNGWPQKIDFVRRSVAYLRGNASDIGVPPARR